MCLYRALLAFNALVVLVLSFFLLTAVQSDGGGDVMSLWLPLLLVPIIGIAAAWGLKAKGRTGPAVVLLAALALVPACLIGFYGFLFATGASWQ